MIVVADTSPLNYLIQIECDSLLPQLYGRILVPTAVMGELGNTAAPPAVSRWLTSIPVWVEESPAAGLPDAELAFLGLGEREAIQLAVERQADLGARFRGRTHPPA